MKHCYIVQPYGQPGTPKWVRARKVRKEYIDPACEQAGYLTHTFSDDEFTDLVKANKYHLQTAPMVVADLGSAPWNENVMMEVGYRLVSKRPIVLLRDTPAGSNDDLPFMLRPHHVIQLPPDPLPKEIDEEVRIELSKDTTRSIVTMIRREESLYASWESSHAVAVVEIDCTTQEEIYIEANSLAAEMLAPDQEHLVGQKGEDIAEFVKEWMVAEQKKPFIEDQERIYTELFGGRKEPISQCPIAFSSAHPNPKFRNRCFRPLIIQNEPLELERGLKKFCVRVLYLDVTSNTEQDEGGVYHYAGRQKAAKTPTAYDVVLDCHPNDRDVVQKVADILTIKGKTAWFSSGDGEFAKQVFENAKALVIFFGKDGGWDNWRTPALIQESSLPLIPVVLPGAGEPDFASLNLLDEIGSCAPLRFKADPDIEDNAIASLVSRIDKVGRPPAQQPRRSGKPKSSKRQA